MADIAMATVWPSVGLGAGAGGDGGSSGDKYKPWFCANNQVLLESVLLCLGKEGGE